MKRNFSYKDENGIEQSTILINFIGGPNSFKILSFSDVLKNRTDYDFKDKIVFIGTTSPDLHDSYLVPTSYGKQMPGVEIHANILQTMLTRNFLHNQKTWSVYLMILLFCLLTAGIIYISKSKVWLTALILFLIIITYFFISMFFFKRGLILNMVYPVISIVLSSISLFSFFYVVEEKNKKWVTDIFGKYVAKDVVNELMKNPDKIKLGGEKREVTLFFSDIRGFTTISEKLTPVKLVHLLNEYLTEMTNIIIKNKGLVDKYMGDAIMAFWGAPLREKNHAKLACISSLEMIEKLSVLNEKLRKNKLPEINIGIGLNTGKVVIGNMGSNERFDYTAMGDAVNLASRLEGLNKEYGTQIIVGETVYAKVKKNFKFRELDYVMVKGKKTPTRIYQLLGKEIDEKTKNAVGCFAKGLALYRKKKFKEAIKYFEKGSKLDDGPSKTFVERCRYYLKHPPERNWNYVWVMKTK